MGIFKNLLECPVFGRFVQASLGFYLLICFTLNRCLMHPIKLAVADLQFAILSS